MSWNGGNIPECMEDVRGEEEVRSLCREVLDWLLLETVEVDAEGVTFERVVQEHRERDEVEFSAIAWSCEVYDQDAARKVRERFLDLLRDHGIKIVPNMNCEKLFKQYRQLRAKSAA